MRCELSAIPLALLAPPTHGRYDALGDSPGAQGPRSDGPRSPSVYSHFSQSVFSQSAYGPSAYGPSQRRLGASGSVGGNSSQYDAASSSLEGSHYRPGRAPSLASEGTQPVALPGGMVCGQSGASVQWPGGKGIGGRGVPGQAPLGGALGRVAPGGGERGLDGTRSSSGGLSGDLGR